MVAACETDCDERLRISDETGATLLSVCAQEARTEDERRQGLVGRQELRSDDGLLLVFPVQGEVCILNTDVPFAIDAVYFDTAGEVVAVERAIAAGDATPRCHEATRAVLEVAAGGAAAVTVGSFVR